MISWFKSKKPDEEQNSFSYEQAVICTIPLDSMEQFGNDVERKEISELEKAISYVMPTNSGIDGHEYGDGEYTLYIYGPSGDDIWKNIEPVLRKSSFDHIDVILQYGQPDDPNTKRKEFTL